MTHQSPTFMARKPTRLTPEQERAMARDIRAAEQVAHEAIADHPAALEILSRPAGRRERTRAGAVDRLEEAYEAFEAISKRDASLRPAALKAGAALKRARDLRWTLAMSGKRIARGEARRFGGVLIDEEDLVHEGYIGLLRAAKRFDPDRGIRFSTYARWWVRAQITRAIDEGGRTIHMSVWAVEQARNLRKLRDEIEASGGVARPSYLAEQLGISEARARQLMSPARSVSIETPIDGVGPRKLADMLPASDAPAPDSVYICSEELDEMRDAFDEVLSAREQHVLVRRFGLDNAKPGTLTEVGAELGLSRERIRQIEGAAIRRLRTAGDTRQWL